VRFQRPVRGRRSALELGCARIARSELRVTRDLPLRRGKQLRA